MISLLIKDDNPIISESLKALLALANDIVVETTLPSLPNFDSNGKLIQPNIILFVAHFGNSDEILNIKRFNRNFERAKIS